MLRSFVAVVFRFVSAVVLCRGDFTTRKNKRDVSLTKSTASSDVSPFPVLVFHVRAACVHLAGFDHSTSLRVYSYVLSVRFVQTARHELKHTPSIFKQRRHAAVCKQSKNIAWENS